MAYAENTKVPVDRSKTEIEHILQKYGASSFAYGWENNAAVVMFRANNRHIRFKLSLPSKNDENIKYRKKYYARSATEALNLIDKITRQKWRALVLVIKAKLECVESGITSFEDEFLAHIVLPSGETIGTVLRPKLEEAYSSGKMPTLLLGAAQ